MPQTITPARLVELMLAEWIPPGGRVFLAGASGEPLAITEALTEAAPRLRGAEVTMLAVPGVNRCPFLAAAAAGAVRVRSFMSTPDLAAAGPECADCWPLPLSRLPALLAAEPTFDVAFFQISAPDRDGFCSWVGSVDVNPDALARCRRRVAQVNRRVPAAAGPDARVPFDAFDYVVWDDTGPFVYRPPRIGAVERAIAAHVAALIPDGSTLQVGFGSLPCAVLEALGGKRDLGIHSGMLVDTMVDLVAAGVITGRCKALDPGRMVATTALGTERLLAFLGGDVAWLRPVTYTHHPHTLAREECLVAVNSALQVDLSGQANAEWIDGRRISGPGGQPDFMGAASRSPSGLAILALPSTARRGSVSSIVARLPEGAPVTTPAYDVGFVVTEYGVADLRGRTLSQRAEALIAIAHPDFRQSLREQWRRAW